MNKSDRFFTDLRRVTKSLWFKLWLREKYYYYQGILPLKGDRALIFMLSICARLIPVTSTVNSPARPAQGQNPIEQLNEQHRFSIPAVSSLGASPTPAR